MQDTTHLWAVIKPYLIQVPGLILILYALWHLTRTRSVVKRFYQQLGFVNVADKTLTGHEVAQRGLLKAEESELLHLFTGWDKARQRPTRAWTGQYNGHTVYQYVARRKRGSNFGRKKSSYRTRYTVTIVETDSEFVPFCARPKRVLDAVDYIFDGEDIKIEGDDDFAKYYHVKGKDRIAVKRCLGKPLRELLMQVEGISIECFETTLIFVRVRDYFEIEGNLTTELDSAVEIARYLGGPAVKS